MVKPHQQKVTTHTLGGNHGSMSSVALEYARTSKQLKRILTLSKKETTRSLVVNFDA
jgi:hypothetical protein